MSSSYDGPEQVRAYHSSEALSETEALRQQLAEVERQRDAAVSRLQGETSQQQAGYSPSTTAVVQVPAQPNPNTRTSMALDGKKGERPASPSRLYATTASSQGKAREKHMRGASESPTRLRNASPERSKSPSRRDFSQVLYGGTDDIAVAMGTQEKPREASSSRSRSPARKKPDSSIHGSSEYKLDKTAAPAGTGGNGRSSMALWDKRERANAPAPAPPKPISKSFTREQIAEHRPSSEPVQQAAFTLRSGLDGVSCIETHEGHDTVHVVGMIEA